MGKGRILVITPHADDESYGMGGTILKRIQSGHEVYIVVVCAGDIQFEHMQKRVIPRSAREAEFKKVLQAYGCEGRLLPFTEESLLDTVPTRDIVVELEKVQDEFSADAWYVPGLSFHQDHRKVFDACAAAARPTRTNTPKELYAYELPLYSWNPPVWRFTPHVYENITDQLDRKIEICNLYESQRRSGPLSVEHIREFSVACGGEASFRAAERFEVIKIRRP